MRIKYIIFDVGGVLQLSKTSVIKIKDGHRNSGVHEYISKKFKISTDQWFDSIDTPYVDTITGKIHEKKAISIMAKNVKVSTEYFKKVVIKGYKKGFKKNRKLYNIACKLKKRGYKIGILSDQWYLSKKALIPKKDMEKFNQVLISCDIGMRKPDLKTYRLLIKKCKCKPSEILFIDNQIWNIKPAKKLGMKTILFKDNKQVINKLKKLGILKK